MNIIFLTMATLTRVEVHGIYTDLMRKFRDEVHQVYIVTPRERRTGEKSRIEDCEGVHFLFVRTLNLQKTNIIEKGVGQLLVESQFRAAIKKYLAGVSFDLILYSTPPITFPAVIEYIKKANPSPKTYLLLKDIFPQNVLDLGMMSKSGIKGILYHFFRKKEKKLYSLSDHIGCMSPANVRYVIEHNPEVSSDRVEVAPNSVGLDDNVNLNDNENNKRLILEKYGLPMDKPVFIYGGNLGKPQGIPFLIECLEANADREDCHFVIIGTGTELPRLKQWHAGKKPTVVTVMDGLPKIEYDELVRSCDVGLIFLDHRFTIPNFPSRLLSYLENRMPVLCATDPNCDMGPIAQDNGFGFWCESNSVEAFTQCVDNILKADIVQMGEKGYQFFLNNYTIEHTYNAIIKHV